MNNTASIHQLLPYPVPFHIERLLPLLFVTNTSDERLRAIRVRAIGNAVISPPFIPSLKPGEQVAIHVHAEHPERNLLLQLSWIRPQGGEYLWQISF